MSIRKTAERYLKIQARLKETRGIMCALRKEETAIRREIERYLQESGETGIRVDADTTISLNDVSKKILVPQKKYPEVVKAVLVKHGAYRHGLERDIIDAKTVGEEKLPKLKVTRQK